MSPARATRSAVRVSANEGLVLGMLARSPGSGYDLVRWIRTSIGYFWTPARSHVYSLLPRLHAAGFVTRREIAGTTAPDKHVYEITQAGREALVAWLSSDELADGPPRNPFLVKVFFGGVLGRDEVVAHIRARRDSVAAELAELEQIARTLDRRASPFGWLALSYGLEQDRALLRWADDALSALSEEPDA